jgi:hypothetical protein
MAARISMRGTFLLLLSLLVVNVISVTLAGDESTVTVSNRTEHYLHVFVDTEQFLYVAPDRSVTYTTPAKPSVLVTVLYAPGQGVQGSVVDTVAVPYSSAHEACNCSEDDVWGDCVVTPAAGGAARIEIWPEDLEDVPEGEG